MDLTPDSSTVFSVYGIAVNATIVNTWIIMAFLVGVSALITRNLRSDVPPNRWRTALEVIVNGIVGQIAEITDRRDPRVMYFAGTLFLFIVTANLLTVVPGFDTPTASLSTTAALALSVLIAVPMFGVGSRGVGGYLKSYLEPSVIMLPFNIIAEFSRGISLAIRLYGNIMSGAVIAVILLGVAPFFFPVLMDLLGLLTGVIQAYIFAILATVYISSATAVPPPADPADTFAADTFAADTSATEKETA
jgi:F-type H+-transporting ATPase subunit a